MTFPFSTRPARFPVRLVDHPGGDRLESKVSLRNEGRHLEPSSDPPQVLPRFARRGARVPVAARVHGDLGSDCRSGADADQMPIGLVERLVSWSRQAKIARLVCRWALRHRGFDQTRTAARWATRPFSSAQGERFHAQGSSTASIGLAVTAVAALAGLLSTSVVVAVSASASTAQPPPAMRSMRRRP